MAAHTLSALLADACARAPDAAAIADTGGTLDWACFARRTENLAARLADLGVTAGEAVALWLPNSAEALAAVFACARLNALAVNINSRFRAAEVADLLARTRARVLITEWGFEPVDFPAILAAIAPQARGELRTVIGRRLPEGVSELAGLATVPLATAAGAAADQARPETAAVTFTTSGTTSGPKLVVHSQRSLAGHAADVARAVGLDAPGAALLAAVPFCGTFGLTAALAAVAGGARIVCLDRFEPARADALIREAAISHAIGGDDMLQRLIEAAGGRSHESLRWFGYAAFTSGAGAAARAAAELGFHPCGVYGSSEVQALFAVNGGADRLTAGGRPVSAEAVVSVRDPETGEALAAGQSGELCFGAPSRFSGYLGDEAATARARTADGLFRSGDLGHLNETGFVFEVRLGDTLRLGGFMVAPEEIEAFLATLPGVSGAQVVGASLGGALRPVAFVTAQPGAVLNEEALIGRCAEAIARFKVPARIITVEAFPVTDGPNGRKIQRARLREMAAALA